MRAAMVRAYGPPEVVAVERVPEPVVTTEHVLVAVQAAALNFPDVLIIANRYQVSVQTPFTPGSEFAGVVVEVGDGVTSVRRGDRVCGATMTGAFAERVLAPAASLSVVPENVDLDEAAAFTVGHLTAYHALRSVASLQRGEWVVVLGAGGGVGLATVELAVLLGGRVVAAASSGKLTVCRAAGAEATIDYHHEDLKARIRELTDGGADVVIDPVGGRYSEPALRAMRWGGRFVTVGYAAGEIPRIPLNLVLLKGVIVKGFEARSFETHASDVAARGRAELFELLRRGLVHPHISAVYPLERVRDALEHVAAGQAVGKILIHVTPPRRPIAGSSATLHSRTRSLNS